MQKMWYIYTMEYYSAIKGQNNAICSTMDAAKDYQYNIAIFISKKSGINDIVLSKHK